jgi:hypothetical protein
MSIFISIASYEDPTLVRTIERALWRSNNPEDLVFGLGLQYEELPDLSSLPQSQLRILSWNPRTRPGIVKVRYEISQLFKDEDYFLMIDSHMQFTQGWDTKLVSVIKELQESTKTYKVIVFPLGLYGKEAMSSRFRIEQRTSKKLPLNVAAQPVNGRYIPEKEIEKISFMRVGQIFFDGRFIKEVGLDSRSQYNQEQAYLGYRAYLSGWDTYQYHQDLMTHDDSIYVASIDQVKAKEFGAVPEIDDSDEDMTMAYIYNTGPYAIPNAERTPDDFWSANRSFFEFTRAKALLDKHNH